MSLGDQVLELARSAEHELLLVAPFAKAGALRRILAEVRPAVTVRCVVRWRLEDLIAGVSDLEVWELVKHRQGASMWLRPDLHAKYYRADKSCLVGSANLTDTALGWSSTPNLEILVKLTASTEPLRAFESELVGQAVLVDDSVAAAMRAALEGLPKESRIGITEHREGQGGSPTSWVDWYPVSRHPEDLYAAYQGVQLSRAGQSAATRDLAFLALPSGLTEAQFKAAVAMLILQHPLIRMIDALVVQPRRFGEVSHFMSIHLSDASDADRAWQTLMRWLLYFLPNRYRTKVFRYTETFFRV